MNKKIKRYTICLKDALEVRKNISFNELKKKIYNYNSNSKNPYFLADLRYSIDKSKLLFDRYKKITINSTLEEIDKTTTQVNNDYELKSLYNLNPRNPHKLVILYRSNKEIQKTPIIYKKDAKLLNKSYLEQTMMKYARVEDFITKILTNKKIEYSSRKSIDDFDYLRVFRDNLRIELPVLVDTYPLSKFIDSYLKDGGKFSYYRLRLLANTLIEYLKEQEVDDNNENCIEEIAGQMMIEEMAMQELRNYYEDLKYKIVEGNYQKVLIPPKS